MQKKLPFLIICIIYLALLLLSFSTKYGVNKIYKSDYLAYYSAGYVMDNISANGIYSLKMISAVQEKYRNGIIPFVNLPFVAIPFTLLSRIPLISSFILFTILSFALHIFSVFLLSKIYKLNTISKTILLLFPTTIHVFQLGQLSNILLFAITLFLYFYKSNKPVLAGLALGLFLIKFQYLLLFPFLLIISKERLAILKGFLASSSFFLFLSYISFGKHLFNNYLNFLINPYDTFWPWTHKNSISIMSLSIILENKTALYIAIFSSFVALCLLLSRYKKSASYADLFFVSIIYCFLVAPYALIHDTVLFIPLIAYMLSKKSFYKNFEFFALYIGIFLLYAIHLPSASFFLLCFIAIFHKINYRNQS